METWADQNAEFLQNAAENPDPEKMKKAMNALVAALALIAGSGAMGIAKAA